MGLEKFVRSRKAVTAMRATESGRPSSWDPASNWDANSVHWGSTDAPRPPSPSNQELMDRKKPFRPTGSEPVKSTTSNYVERGAPKGNEYRQTSYGDD
jgi:hypothetical protein